MPIPDQRSGTRTGKDAAKTAVLLKAPREEVLELCHEQPATWNPLVGRQRYDEDPGAASTIHGSQERLLPNVLLPNARRRLRWSSHERPNDFLLHDERHDNAQQHKPFFSDVLVEHAKVFLEGADARFSGSPPSSIGLRACSPGQYLGQDQVSGSV